MNYAKFEKLNGISLGMFVSDAIKRAEIDEGVLDYYYRSKANLDNPHLEMILLLLGELGTPAALNEVANFLDHPAKSVRYQAAQVITNAPTIEENVMAKVISLLTNPPYPSDGIKYEDALEHGATERARALSASFREAQGARKK